MSAKGNSGERHVLKQRQAMPLRDGFATSSVLGFTIRILSVLYSVHIVVLGNVGDTRR